MSFRYDYAYPRLAIHVNSVKVVEWQLHPFREWEYSYLLIPALALAFAFASALACAPTSRGY